MIVCNTRLIMGFETVMYVMTTIVLKILYVIARAPLSEDDIYHYQGLESIVYYWRIIHNKK